jgi:predicted porin
MYSVIAVNNYTGIEFNYDRDINDFTIMSTALYGESQSVLYTDINQGSLETLNVYTDKIYALTFKLLYDDFSFRIGYSDFKLTLPNKEIDNLLNGLNSLGIPLISQAVNQYQIKDASVQYLEIGAKYDFENAYLVAEHMTLDNNTFLSNNHAWYVGMGYNFKNWSPFVLYSKVDSSQNYKNIESKEGMPIELLGAINGTNQVLSAISDSMVQVELKTLSLGTTYNLSENSLLKLQYDRQEEFKKNRLNFHSSNDNKVDLDIFSAAISFVF